MARPMNAVIWQAFLAREQIAAETQRDIDNWAAEVRENLGKEM